MEGTDSILIVHSKEDYSKKFSSTIAESGFDVEYYRDVRELVVKGAEELQKASLLGLELESMSLGDISLLDRLLIDNSLKEKIKTFAIIAQSTKFTPVVLEKIRTLKPRDFIVETSRKDEIMFRLNNILYEDTGLRKNYRALMNIMVHCDYMQDFFDAESFTISRDGIFIKTSRNFPRQAKIFMTFKLPTSKRDFATMGSLLYSINENSPRPRISPAGAGIYFVDLSGDERESIDSYIRGRA